MAEEQMRGVIDGIRAKLQAELEAQLGNLANSHDQALEEARQRAAADAEQRWAAKLNDIHTQWGSRLESEVGAARAEGERALSETVARARTEAEHAAAQAAAQARREVDEAVATERARAQADLERAHAERERAQVDRKAAMGELQRAHRERERTQEELQRAQAERQQTQHDLQRAHADHQRAQEDLQRAHGERERAQQDLQHAHEALERAQQQLQRTQAEAEAIREQASRELEQARQQHAVDRASAADALADARQAAVSIPRDASELLISLRAIDDATSLTDALAAAVRGASLESPRAALFVVNGATLEEWPVDGVPPVHAGPIRADGREAGFLSEVLSTGETVSIDGTN